MERQNEIMSSMESKLVEAGATVDVTNTSFEIATEHGVKKATITIGEGDKAIQKECIIVPSYDGKKAFQIESPEAITAYERISYLRTLQKVSGYAIPCELHKVAKNGSYKVSKDIDTIQKYAKTFFGYSSTTCNQYLRVVEYFLDYGEDESGKSYYKVKAPFSFHLSLTMGHFIEMLAYTVIEKGDGKTPDTVYDINEFYTLLDTMKIDFNVSTSKLRDELKKAFGKGIVDGTGKEVKEGESNGEGEGNGNGEGEGNGEGNGENTLSPRELAIAEYRNALSTITAKIELYPDMVKDIKRVQKLTAELTKLLNLDNE